MRNIYIFTAILALCASIIAAPVGVFAQVGYSSSYSMPTNYGATPASIYPPISGQSGCIALGSNLYKGLIDGGANGQIWALQTFLIQQRYLNIARPTSYFGSLTSQALMRYQSAYGLPVTGIADAATRASIQNVTCNGAGYNNNGGYNYNNGGYNAGAPVITSLSVMAGAVGSNVTIYGSGFDPNNNTINFGGVPIYGVPSYQGVALAFTVPQVNNQIYNNNYNYNYNNGYNANGTYPVTVTDSRGTSNSLSFTLTGYNYNYNNNYNNGGYCNGIYYNGGYNNTYNGNCYNNNNGSISVSNVSGPTTIQTGTQGLWSLTLYNPNSNYVTVSARWGDEGTYNYYGATAAQSAQSSYVQGQQTITFTHTYQTAGTYTVVFTATDNQGAQTSVSATVNVSGNGTIYGTQPSLYSISPASGRVGTQVVLTGSGFTPTGNTVHFGNGGMSNVAASNGGNTIYYTIPYSVGPCDITTGGYFCATYAQQVTPGSYPIYVSNAYGQTGTIYFSVTY